MFPEAFTLLDIAEQRRRDLIDDASVWRRGVAARRFTSLHRRGGRSHTGSAKGATISRSV